MAIGARPAAGRRNEDDGDRPWAINGTTKLREAPAAACAATAKLLRGRA